mmetsp:Transcript_12847/g.36330  ORF Transcript_12847/g.36330 Transcript_12847/m.36330 type:complete len:120 (+) Transcript_12847:220-579(+)
MLNGKPGNVGIGTSLPNERSVVILDNWSKHHKLMPEIHRRVVAKGAIVIYQPPYSPDLNIIEKMWDLLAQRMSKLAFSLAHGLHDGNPRPINFADLLQALADVRATERLYEECINKALD